MRSVRRIGVTAVRTCAGYVLGQMADEHSIAGLKKVRLLLRMLASRRQRLEDGQENYMVRHECAEALGAIATAEVN